MKKILSNNYIKGVLGALLGTLIYFILPYFQGIPFQLLGLDPKTLPLWVKTIYLIAYEILILLLITSVFQHTLEKDWKDMKKNHKSYFNTYFKYWFLILFLMMISNGVITLINHGDIANNEQTIRDTFKLAPIYTFFSAVIYAPMTEELIFRQGVRNIIKNNVLFILISGLLFGSMHVIPSYHVPLDLLYILPYSIPGWVFAYILTKSKNIFVPMGLHFIHNGILMSLQFLIYFFM